MKGFHDPQSQFYRLHFLSPTTTSHTSSSQASSLDKLGHEFVLKYYLSVKMSALKVSNSRLLAVMDVLLLNKNNECSDRIAAITKKRPYSKIMTNNSKNY